MKQRKGKDNFDQVAFVYRDDATTEYIILSQMSMIA